MRDLASRLRDRIRHDGPMPFCDWMEACLYDPDAGYYMAPQRVRTGPGPDADFATSPTLHPFLAHAVAHEARDLWQRLGRPSDFRIIEYGGGRGDLARDALAWLDAHAPGLAAGVQWLHVESGPGQATRVGGDARIQHADGLPRATTGLVVAHEFVDALPFHWLEWRKGGWAEVHVTWTGERFAQIIGIPTRSAIEAAPKRRLQEGQRVVAMAKARHWMEEVAARIARGGVLVVDYGDLGRDLWVPERRDGTVRGFRGHRLVEDILSDPGECDITASVDFTQLRVWGLEAGLLDGGLETQEAYLVRHGALDALAAAPRDTVEDASRYLRLKQIVLPQGMGRAFKVQRFWKDIEAPTQGRGGSDGGAPAAGAPPDGDGPAQDAPQDGPGPRGVPPPATKTKIK